MSEAGVQTREEPVEGEARHSEAARSLVTLAHRVGVEGLEAEAILREIAGSAADLLGVDRVGIWLFRDDDERLRCVTLFDRGPEDRRSPGEGAELLRSDAPAYFEALRDQLALAIGDTFGDPRTAELREGYLEPTGITALLDAPIRRGGEISGIVCHEARTRIRDWTADDEHLAGLVADLVALALEARDRRRMEAALRASERRYRELFERNVAGVYRTTPTGEILEVNAACARMLGYDSPEELKREMNSAAVSAYADPDDRARVVRKLKQYGRLENHEARLVRKGGGTLWALENAILVDDPGLGGKVIEGTLTDITDRKHLEEELERMAYHDALTGLANRRLLKEQADRILARARRNGESVGLIYLDLARFKRINDTLGHAAGDRVLTAAARRLEEHVRESDMVARVGGDEFAILLADVDGEQGLRDAARRVAEGLETPIATADRAVHVEARLGLALYPDHASHYDGLLTAADRALQQSYAAGSSGVHLFRPGEAMGPGLEVELEDALQQALASDRLELYYQPIVRMVDDAVEGAEALLRWQHPERGIVSAGEFLHLADRTTLALEIDRWVLERAIRQIPTWADAGIAEWVSVNLSAASLRDRSLPERVGEALREAGVEPGRLVLEVSEGMAVRNPELVMRTLRELRGVGVGVAIDNFGTGHSALTHLRHFPANLLKVDGSLIESLAPAERSGELARAIIGLGRALGMRVAVECVEHGYQRRWLREAGCELGQGYGFGIPAPPAEFASTRDRKARRESGNARTTAR